MLPFCTNSQCPESLRGYCRPYVYNQPRAKPWLLLFFQSPPTTGKTVAIIGLPLRGREYDLTWTLCPSLPSAGASVICISSLRHSTFDIRYSTFIPFLQHRDISQKPHCIYWHPSNSKHPRAKPWLLLFFQSPPSTGKTVAIIGLPLRGREYDLTWILCPSLPSAGASVICISSLRHSTFDIRYSIFYIPYSIFIYLPNPIIPYFPHFSKCFPKNEISSSTDRS